MPKQTLRGLSDGTMMRHWRSAVKAIHGDRCKICGAQPVECHHIVHRNRMRLRYDSKNGLPLCVECHRFAETLLGRTEIAKHVDIEYLQYREQIVFKDYLVKHGMTRAEFLQNQLDELKAICDNPSVAKYW